METINAALPDVRHHLGVLDKALAGKEFLVGDAVTLADLFLTPILFYVGEMPEGTGLLGPLANVRRWIEAMAARPSFTETIPSPLPQADAAA